MRRRVLMAIPPLPAPIEVARVAGGRHGEIRHSKLAAEMGVHTRTLRRAYQRAW